MAKKTKNYWRKTLKRNAGLLVEYQPSYEKGGFTLSDDDSTTYVPKWEPKESHAEARINQIRHLQHLHDDIYADWQTREHLRNQIQEIRDKDY